MKTVAFLFLSLASPLLYAQRMDTTEVENGVYGVFQPDRRGYPKHPVAVYDTTGRLIRRESYHAGHLHGPVIFYDSLGRKTRSGNYKKGKKHGSDIFYYPDGSVRLKWPYRNGYLHGLIRSFHPNGNIEWTGAYRIGTLFGERILRDSMGTLFNGEYTTVFPMGLGHFTISCSNGRPYGKLTVFRSNGEVGYTGRFVNGFPDGEFLYLDKEGKVWRKEYYVTGKFERSTQRGDNGGPVTTD